MRRFYSFNSTEDVRNHVSQVKTHSDFNQLLCDISQSGTNLTYYEGTNGVYQVVCLAGEEEEIHLFFNNQELYQLYADRPDMDFSLFTTVTILED